jgi:antitoxin (DNA-binding transcriptional repressor) of toxin-antitoxin stability system
MKTINSFEAKTHLSRLLRDVEQNNEEIVIKRHNRSIARLVPYGPFQGKKANALDVIAGFHDIRDRQPAGSTPVKKLVGEGRKR